MWGRKNIFASKSKQIVCLILSAVLSSLSWGSADTKPKYYTLNASFDLDAIGKAKERQWVYILDVDTLEECKEDLHSYSLRESLFKVVKPDPKTKTNTNMQYCTSWTNELRLDTYKYTWNTYALFPVDSTIGTKYMDHEEIGFGQRDYRCEVKTLRDSLCYAHEQISEKDEQLKEKLSQHKDDRFHQHFYYEKTNTIGSWWSNKTINPNSIVYKLPLILGFIGEKPKNSKELIENYNRARQEYVSAVLVNYDTLAGYGYIYNHPVILYSTDRTKLQALLQALLDEFKAAANNTDPTKLRALLDEFKAKANAQLNDTRPELIEAAKALLEFKAAAKQKVNNARPKLIQAAQALRACSPDAQVLCLMPEAPLSSKT